MQRNLKLTLVLSTAVALAGCASASGSANPAVEVDGGSGTTPSTLASASPQESGETGFRCPPDGGECLGPLDAGTYTTQVFSPPITYTVPDGWQNGEDLPGNFLLQLQGDARYLGIDRDIAAPMECEEAPEPGVEQTVSALTAWLTEHEGLVTTEPQPVSVGGLDGVYLDISLDPAWTVGCPFSQGNPVVPFIIGGGVSSLHHVIGPGMETRLYLLEYDGGNIAIEVGPEGESLADYLDEVIPIIESLAFGT